MLPSSPTLRHLPQRNKNITPSLSLSLPVRRASGAVGFGADVA